MKAQMLLAEADVLAQDLAVHLVAATERIAIAGSVRRRKTIVGDIELVALPRFEDRQRGLFPDDVERVNLLQARIDDAIMGGILAPDPDDPKRGERYAKLRHTASGAQVDLFMPGSPGAFGLVLLIRTGPADYSRRLVTDMKAGLRPHHVARSELHDGAGLVCAPAGSFLACRVIPTPEEADVYEAIGLPFVRPEERA